MVKLVKKLGENYFYYVRQAFNNSVSDLFKKKDFFPMTTGIALKNSQKAYLAKISFVKYWLIMKFEIKVMSIFFTFRKLLK